MSLDVGIVGLPNVGKSTIFNALTAAGALAANYPFATIEPNIGIVNVPDPRLKQIQQYIPTDKLVPASVRIVDIAGIVRGASTGEGLGNKFLSHIREVDEVLQVVRCFEDPDITHVDGKIDPLRDIETINTELCLADLETVQSTMDKAIRLARSGDKEATARVDILKKVLPLLEAGRPARAADLNEDEKKLIKSLGLMTAKKTLFVANVAENDLEGKDPLVQQVRDYAQSVNSEVVPVCGKLEAELSELPEADRNEMLESLGLKEPALASLTRAAYHLLGLQSFFTAGQIEVRAWTITQGTKAPQAAGVIHGDLEKSFIKAEVFTVDDLLKYKSEAAIKAAGRLRLEGKDYVMQDGDVVHFQAGLAGKK